MAKAKTQEIVSIKDERLNIDQIDHYRLSFFIGEGSLEFAVKDLKTKRLLLFERQVCDPSQNILEQLEYIYNDHILIAAGFWNEIQVFKRNPKFALIPNPLFDKTKLYEYVRLNDATDPEEDGYHFKQLDDFGLSYAFGYQEKIKDWFKSHYPKVRLRFSHQGVAYLKYIQQEIKQNAHAALYLNIGSEHAMVCGLNFEKLALYNQFKFKNAEHLVKLTALSCQQFSTDRSKTPLVLTGHKESIEKLKPTLKKYFNMLELGKRPVDLQIHPIFNELESYEYTEILANL